MNLTPKFLEPPSKMLSSPPLGVTAGRPRPKLINERLSLGKGVDVRSLHAASLCPRGVSGERLNQCPGWDSNPHVPKDNAF